MDVCARCGVIAPEQATKVCAGCGDPLAGTPAPASPLMLVAVRCRFPCRSCGHMSPLDRIVVEGDVQCLRCGTHQSFPKQVFGPMTAWAHGLADLAGPAPEGRSPSPHFAIADQNPFRAVGLTHALEEEAFTAPDRDGMQRSLHVAAAPGNPTCHRCKVALAVELVGRGEAITRCPTCAATEAFQVPADTLVFRGLVGVVGDEHRTGEAEAAAGAGSDTQSFRCPGCGAPLDIAHDDRHVTCDFCHTTSRVPTSARPFDPAKDVRPATWWLVFKGESETRKTLEAGREDARKLESPQEGKPGTVGRTTELALRYGLPGVLVAVVGVFGVAIVFWPMLAHFLPKALR